MAELEKHFKIDFQSFKNISNIHEKMCKII